MDVSTERPLDSKLVVYDKRSTWDTERTGRIEKTLMESDLVCVVRVFRVPCISLLNFEENR